MKKSAAILLILISLSSLVGCSALVVATGTNEEDIIQLGASKDHVAGYLGDPIRVEPLPEPIELRDLNINHYYEVEVFAGKLSESSKKAVEKAYYKYVGEVQGKHDVGELVSVNLMTFGIAELFALPAAIGDRATKSEHLFEVWFNAEGQVLAYKRSKVAE